MAPKPPPEELEDDTTVNQLHRGQDTKVKRALGKLDEEASISLATPSPLKKGPRQTPRAAVGLRAAAERVAPSPKAMEAINTANDKVRTQRDERRQKVWDKLDAARKAADEKLPRFSSFQPKKPR